jgi:hypothetical protein
MPDHVHPCGRLPTRPKRIATIIPSFAERYITTALFEGL